MYSVKYTNIPQDDMIFACTEAWAKSDNGIPSIPKISTNSIQWIQKLTVKCYCFKFKTSYYLQTVGVAMGSKSSLEISFHPFENNIISLSKHIIRWLLILKQTLTMIMMKKPLLGINYEWFTIPITFQLFVTILANTDHLISCDWWDHKIICVVRMHLAIACHAIACYQTRSQFEFPTGTHLGYLISYP